MREGQQISRNSKNNLHIFLTVISNRKKTRKKKLMTAIKEISKKYDKEREIKIITAGRLTRGVTINGRVGGGEHVSLLGMTSFGRIGGYGCTLLVMLGEQCAFLMHPPSRTPSDVNCTVFGVFCTYT